MDNECSERHLDIDTLRFVKFKTRQITGRYGFLRDDDKDIQQTLIEHCLESLPRFDPHRGEWRTFAKVIINRKIASLVESQRAQRRDYHCLARSLTSPVAGPNSPQLGDTLSHDDYHRRINGRTLSEEQGLELRCDIERVLATMTPDLRWICGLLVAMDRIGEVAKVAGVSRATLHRRMRLIRDEFVKNGFSHCLNWSTRP